MTPEQRAEALRLADELDATLQTSEPHGVAALLRALAAQSQGEPYAWTVSGLGRPFYGEFAEDDARNEARRIGGSARAFPLYTSPPPAHKPLTHMQIVMLWGHRPDGPSTPEIVSFARHIERAHGIGEGA